MESRRERERLMAAFDLAIIGGGPAGSSAAISAARGGKRVLLLERGRFPRHKVCGEFLSPEAESLLRDLLAESAAPLLADAVTVGASRFFMDGRVLSAPISPPALSVTRFALDATLWHTAQQLCDCRDELTVQEITRSGNTFHLRTDKEEWEATSVINATGRWSNLTRTTFKPDTPRWVGVKAHFRESNPQPSVDLYFFAGGYCGVQPIGVDSVNACAMVRADVASSLDEVLALDPLLQQRSGEWEPLMEPVSTAPLVFRRSAPVREDGVLNVGDAAGFIDPFAGDGIAIALRSGTKAALSTPAEYADWYRREVVPAFRAAARLRRLFRAPRWVRSAAMSVLGNQRMAAWAVKATRSRVS
jgi:flavin-dependent dehydrogenase